VLLVLIVILILIVGVIIILLSLKYFTTVFDLRLGLKVKVKG